MSPIAGRRAALPNGRAVVGGLLVAAASVGTYAAWAGAGEGPSARFVVAARDLAVGEVLETTDLALIALDVPIRLADRAFASVAPVVGQRTIAPLAAGELVQRSAVVVPAGTGDGRQVALAVDEADALGGTLQAGEAVDVVVTDADAGTGSITEVVAARAIVARLTVGDVGGQVVVLLDLATGTDVLALVDGARRGSVALVRSLGPALAVGDRFERDATG